MAKVLAATAAHLIGPVSPRDVVVAIVGGTMLTLALTRPRLRWVEQLTEDSESKRIWAERALTFFAFAMGGYAWTSLFIVLHKQLGSEIDTVLRGAGYFMLVYGLLVHFEPFVTEWRLGGWLGAIVLYAGVTIFAASTGMAIADILLSSSFSLVSVSLLSITATIAGVCWLIYKLMPRLEAWMNRIGATRQAP